MTAEEIEEMHGKAQKIEFGKELDDGSTGRGQWYYPEMGIVLRFDGKSVSHISLLKNSNFRFDRSGLNCHNKPQEFANAYSMKRVPEVSKKNSGYVSYSIGHGEYLYFGHNMSYIGLDIYPY